jgi:hypothetical protein
LLLHIRSRKETGFQDNGDGTATFTYESGDNEFGINITASVTYTYLDKPNSISRFAVKNIQVNNNSN